MDLLTLVTRLVTDGTLAALGNNPAAQFGLANRRYLGAELLPERQVETNDYRETDIKYRTVIANDGTRYSPPQKKQSGILTGDFLVSLGHQDVAAEMNARDYEALLRMLGNRASMEAEAQIINWVDAVVVRALVELMEKQRWDAIINAQVVRLGDNAYREVVNYSNPSGHRVAAGGVWSNDAYDPYADIMAMVDMLAGKGYAVTRIVTSRKVVSILARNDKIAGRAGTVRVVGTANYVGRVSQDQINAALAADGIPPIELYDLRYNTQTGNARFMPDTVMTFFCTTGRDLRYDLGDSIQFVPDTLGYLAVGVGVGQLTPGRVTRLKAFDDKPPRLEASGWQASLPVITEPEAMGVITGIG